MTSSVPLSSSFGKLIDWILLIDFDYHQGDSMPGYPWLCRQAQTGTAVHGSIRLKVEPSPGLLVTRNSPLCEIAS